MAFDFMEGTTASQFGKDKHGWKVLLKVLEHFNGKPFNKVSSAMDHFFAAENLKDGETYANLAVRFEQASQQCHDCKLEIQDPIDIRQFLILPDISEGAE